MRKDIFLVFAPACIYNVSPSTYVAAWSSPQAACFRSITSSSSAASSNNETPCLSSLKDTKASLLKQALIGGRGVWSRPAEREEAATLIENLERHPRPSGGCVLQDGTWELVLSDVEPFRASVFFLALAEAVEANLIPNASDGALTVHSLATGGGEVGRVAHVIEGGGSRLHSLVELTSGSLPSLPVSLAGTVVSSGELSVADEDDDRSGTVFSLSLRNTTVQESRVRYGLPTDAGLRPGVQPDFLSWIGDQLVPSGEIFSSVLDPIGGGQTALLELSFSDDEMMVWRTPRLASAGSDKGHFFCFLRGREASWPAMDELRRRGETAKESTIGSAFALGMLNPFFSRRAGIKR